jgi:hypothetical protein
MIRSGEEKGRRQRGVEVGMPGLDKLEIAWAEDRATQGCDLSADRSADRSGAVLTVAPGRPCWPKSDKSRGFGGRAPIWKKGYLPFEKPLTNGGESWPAADPLVGLLEHRKSRTRGSGADEGVRPTFWLRPCCFVGHLFKLQPPFRRRLVSHSENFPPRFGDAS